MTSSLRSWRRLEPVDDYSLLRRSASNKCPDRWLFGTDEVGPTDQGKYFKTYDIYAPLFTKLTPEAKQKILKGNYERLFDEARRRVRAWEKAHVK